MQPVPCFSPVMVEGSPSLSPVQSESGPAEGMWLLGGTAGKHANCAHALEASFKLSVFSTPGVPGGAYPIESTVLHLPEPVSCLCHGGSAFLGGCLTREVPGSCPKGSCFQEMVEEIAIGPSGPERWVFLVPPG